MTRNEFIRIESNDEFWGLHEKCKLSPSDKSAIVLKRWEYLWDKYKPPKEHIKGRREYGKTH